ncbi:hypothetical protein MNEG_12232, partial [Monoraphidium neglectum]
ELRRPPRKAVASAAANPTTSSSGRASSGMLDTPQPCECWAPGCGPSPAASPANHCSDLSPSPPAADFDAYGGSNLSPPPGSSAVAVTAAMTAQHREVVAAAQQHQQQAAAAAHAYQAMIWHSDAATAAANAAAVAAAAAACSGTGAYDESASFAEGGCHDGAGYHPGDLALPSPAVRPGGCQLGPLVPGFLGSSSGAPLLCVESANGPNPRCDTAQLSSREQQLGKGHGGGSSFGLAMAPAPVDGHAAGPGAVQQGERRHAQVVRALESLDVSNEGPRGYGPGCGGPGYPPTSPPAQALYAAASGPMATGGGSGVGGGGGGSGSASVAWPPLVGGLRFVPGAAGAFGGCVAWPCASYGA